MERILELIESYGISRNRVPHHEQLEVASYENAKEIMEYLYDTKLLKSKFIINKLATLLSTRTKNDLKWVENFLTVLGYDPYPIMYKANSLLFSDDRQNISEVAIELRKKEYNLDHNFVITTSSSLLTQTNAEHIKDTMNLLNKYRIDARTASLKSGLIFDKRSLKSMEEIIIILYAYYGEDEAKELLYKCPSLMAKGSPNDVKFCFGFFEAIMGKEKTQEYFKEYTSLLSRVNKDRLTSNYNTLVELGIEEIIHVSANILIYGDSGDIRNNFLWLQEQDSRINTLKAPATLTYSHDVVKRNYNFYKSHGLEEYICDCASCLGCNKTEEELEAIYQYLVGLGITDFKETLSVFTNGNIHEIEEIRKLLIEELGIETASVLMTNTSVLTTNYNTIKSSLGFLRAHDLFSELIDKPYVLSETKKDKMENNLTFLEGLGLTDATRSIIVLSRGNTHNMTKIVEYLKSLDILDVLESCPTLLTKKYANVKKCIDFFIQHDKLHIVKSTPSIALLKVDEIEQAHNDIEVEGLTEMAEQMPGMYRGKNIRKTKASVNGGMFKGTSGVAAVYSAQVTRLNARKDWFDRKGLQHLYIDCPTLLSEGDIELMEESYDYLVEEGFEELILKAKSILSRLRGRDATKARIEHLYELGLKKEEITPTFLIRYTDEEILRAINYKRTRALKSKKSK